MARIKAAVIFGGVSSEHELSLASAVDVIESIPAEKYEVICIGITKKGRWLFFPGGTEEIADGSWEMNPDCTSAVISPDPIHKGILTIENGEVSLKRIDVVFPLLHGKFGADGSIQGLLDMAGIPYVGCGLLASASCMDKSHIHMILDDYNIKTAAWRLITQREINDLDSMCETIAGELGFPLKAKPANCGSSVGCSRADNVEELEAAVKTAFSHDNKVVVERFIEGRELVTAVYGYDSPVCSYVGEILSTNGHINSKETFAVDGGELKIPADMDDDTISRIRRTAVDAYKALGCKGMARVDFFMDANGELYLNKIAAMPAFSKDAIYPQLMEHMGTDLPELIDLLCEQAVENAERTY